MKPVEDVSSVPKQPTIKRLNSTFILLAVFGPMLIAYLVFKTGIGMPTSTINKGVLLSPPQQLDSLRYWAESGEGYAFTDQPGKWRILIPSEGICDEVCAQNLYVTRQVHTRLNDKYHRVERVFINLNDKLDNAARELLNNRYPQVKILSVDPQKWKAMLAQTNWHQGQYLLVDQENFAMMFYTQTQTGNDFLADLKRMLKYSREQ